MKIIWMILLGMVLFNFFIMSFSIFFPQSPLSSEVNNYDISQNESISQFKNPGSLSVAGIIGSIDLLVLVGSGALAYLAKDAKFIIAGSMIALSTTMWNASAGIFSNLFNELNNPVLPSIFVAISVAIGLTLAIGILGILAGQDQT